MEPLVDTVIEDDRWEAFGLPALATRAAEATFATLGVHGVTLALMGCDDAEIARLNGEFRDKAKPTNVLSWPSEDRAAGEPGGLPDLSGGDDDDPDELGDIAIAWDTCMAEAEAQGKSPQDHVTHLVVHGILHLLGYDHETDADAELMEGTETRILATLHIKDPYVT
ncbi:rRNA maturation RNase YbeY [Falsirhodobacter halotolerans]|uniref:rRNA maturation RNase YbeY n=1 Tax=Falsirhodobacter halotolerans TaxID=1146892 RepID=UPI001FD41789|nr:rRNA maturation RNase YbeY [Falsirhodobacter halotolerans]MCJ8138773.1 rRNA maturation RNase YbeY [Falsirhodobacter halotolerans]